MQPITKLTRVVRARAKHFFGLPIGVTQKGNGFILSIADKKSGRRESEYVEVDTKEIGQLIYNEEALEDYADQIINRFMFPVTSLPSLHS